MKWSSQWLQHLDLISHNVLYKLLHTQLHYFMYRCFQPDQSSNQNVAYSLLIDI